MNYLITGGAGFIGFNLANVLSNNSSNKIVIFDNMNMSIVFKGIIVQKSADKNIKEMEAH